MSKEYDLTFHGRDEAIFGLDRLLVPAERLTDRLDYLEEARNKQENADAWQHRKDNNLHSLRDRQYVRELAKTEMPELKNTHLRSETPIAAANTWEGRPSSDDA